MDADQRGLMHGALTDHIIREFYAVYNELGHGFLESVYESAMTIALRMSGLEVQCQCPIPVYFRGSRVGDFRADVVVAGRVLLELKAVRVLEPAHEAQLLHYLRATDLEVGLLLNFGPKPSFKRFVFANGRKAARTPAPTGSAQPGPA